MKRRSVLALSVVMIPLAGCSEESDPDVAEDIFVRLHNESSDRVTVMVSVVTGDSVVFEDQTSIAPSNVEEMYPGISETGEYTLTVSLDDGREREYPLVIEDYDLQMGSNIGVSISETDIQMRIEE